MRLDARTAVVVGAGSPVGTATVELLAREGAEVLAVETAAAPAFAADRVVAHVADVSTEAAAAGVAARCSELWPRLDVLVYCPGDLDWWSPEDDSAENWGALLDTNVLGALRYTKWLRPLLRLSDAGSIVYLGSIDGVFCNPRVPAYSVSKGALITLTHGMAHTCGLDGTRVNCVAASMLDPSRPGSPPLRHHGDTQALQKLIPLPEPITPESVAAVILFFASDDSRLVNGTVLPVDGGRTAITPGTGWFERAAREDGDAPHLMPAGLPLVRGDESAV